VLNGGYSKTGEEKKRRALRACQTEGSLQKGVTNMLEKVKVSVEFFDRLGRVKEEVEAAELNRDIIRKLRNSEWFYSGYLTIYSRNNVTRLYFNDTMPELIGALNNLLEEMEVAHA
jgi:hypothetical protein